MLFKGVQSLVLRIAFGEGADKHALFFHMLLDGAIAEEVVAASLPLQDILISHLHLVVLLEVIGE